MQSPIHQLRPGPLFRGPCLIDNVYANVLLEINIRASLNHHCKGIVIFNPVIFTINLPCDTVLKSDNVVEVLSGQKGEALQLLSDCIQGLAHPHRVHLGLESESEKVKVKKCPIRPGK